MKSKVSVEESLRMESRLTGAERITAHEEAAARLKGGGRWGSNNPITGDCFGLPQEQCPGGGGPRAY